MRRSSGVRINIKDLMQSREVPPNIEYCRFETKVFLKSVVSILKMRLVTISSEKEERLSGLLSFLIETPSPRGLNYGDIFMAV